MELKVNSTNSYATYHSISIQYKLNTHTPHYYIQLHSKQYCSNYFCYSVGISSPPHTRVSSVSYCNKAEFQREAHCVLVCVCVRVNSLTE